MTALCVLVFDWSVPVSQARWSPEQPALCGVRGSDGDREEQRQGLLPRRAENHAGHHGAAAAGPANGGEGAVLGAERYRCRCEHRLDLKVIQEKKHRAEINWFKQTRQLLI